MPGRGVGVTQALERLLAPWMRELFTLITQLGDAWFLFAAVAFVYWFGNRRRGAFALSAVLGALALTLALKGLFALPRPPVEVQIGHASGYGFPSGHAIGATVLWGLLALILERGSHRWRAIGAGAVVAVVATSRLVIGVHYVADVVVGIAIGLAYLAALLYVTDWSPSRGFVVAAGLALAGVATNGLTPDSVSAVAGVVGGGVTWSMLDARPSGAVHLPAALVGLAVLGGVGYVGHRLSLPLPAVFVLNALVPVGILVLPLAVERAKSGRSASPT
ncbi:phosphatase PAP2 family protein [Halorussus gelatinilyticus]|uniref:Phosphatase PAP2 family protein n=1 Tax=Halorussus gelatinilyticus TaxID=2937524 RepID=A0A8U0IK27_9EURY|nr:phosphatase PAP2 family protein [Halorussus gelatinilyticus]UPW01490.1 phosphatase PAP2 family protein [Halorussus gelatinilyticus]